MSSLATPSLPGGQWDKSVLYQNRPPARKRSASIQPGRSKRMRVGAGAEPRPFFVDSPHRRAHTRLAPGRLGVASGREGVNRMDRGVPEQGLPLLQDESMMVTVVGGDSPHVHRSVCTHRLAGRGGTRSHRCSMGRLSSSAPFVSTGTGHTQRPLRPPRPPTNARGCSNSLRMRATSSQ